MLKIFIYASLVFVVVIGSSGCATTSTLNQAPSKGKPIVMSGTRLDAAALRVERGVEDRFGVSPPRFPIIDLPFSFMLDFLVLGYSIPTALMYRR